jgi:tetrapyrrole methylase family protein/MazG family protein
MAHRKRKRKAAKRAKPTSRNSRATPVGPAFEKLVALMSRLRSPSGCPWDREQTHATLRTYLIEEAYEVLDALESTDDAKFAEELGDLLLQVLFHAQIAREEGRFSIADVVREIYEKMIRRHPHVFGKKRAKDAAEVLRNWEIIKAQERQAKIKGVKETKEAKEGGEAREIATSSFTSSTSSTPLTSLLDGVPRSLPALLEGFQLTRKAARIGFDWDKVEGIFAKLAEETNELRHLLAAPHKDAPRIQSELGDILFVAINLARFLDVDPEIAAKEACAKFSRRFREMERLALEQGKTLADVPRAQMESFWEQSKRNELPVPSRKLAP